MPRNSEKQTFTQREIASALSNAVVQARHPTNLRIIPDERIRRLREYAQAACEAMLEHCDEQLEDGSPLLRPEELVLILSVGALWVQASRVMRSCSVPNQLCGDMLFGTGKEKE